MHSLTQQQLTQQAKDRQVAIWLLFVAASIFFMIILGGATRLTHSGLSMVDWKPIMGIIPPLNQQQWMETFSRYQQFPEYQKLNIGMSVEEFKAIFYFEYFHRLLGRLIGMIFLLPFLVLWFRGVIRRSMLPQMIMLFILGGFQGVLGWYMVKSGLVNDPQVSQYRLSAHLIAAVMIFSALLWVAFGLLQNTVSDLAVLKDRELRNKELRSKMYRYSKGVVALVIFMILSGGFVAGTKAGYAYNTFPLMAGQLVPDGMFIMQPFWLNWFENITAVQFNHRLIALIIFLLIPLFSFKLYRYSLTETSRRLAVMLVSMLAIQISLGISTLVFFMPVAVAVSHQGGAIILLTIAVYICRDLRSESKITNLI